MNTTSVLISGHEIQRITYQDEPVVTFAIIDKIHERPEGTAGRTFRENRQRFIRNEDYYEPTSDEIRRMSQAGIFPHRTARGKLLTRRGYLKITKEIVA